MGSCLWWPSSEEAWPAAFRKRSGQLVSTDDRVERQMGIESLFSHFHIRSLNCDVTFNDFQVISPLRLSGDVSWLRLLR